MNNFTIQPYMNNFTIQPYNVKNYLNHEFIFDPEVDIVHCEKCNIKLFWEFGDYFYICEGTRFKRWERFYMTCEEVIIKNIIE